MLCVVLLRIKINYIYKTLNATIIRGDIKGNYTRKIRYRFTNINTNISDTALTYLLEIVQSRRNG